MFELGEDGACRPPFLFMKRNIMAAMGALIFAMNSSATPGKLDTAFVSPDNGRIWSIDSTPTGNIYVAGRSLERLNSDGTPDARFVCPVTMTGMFDSMPVVLADADGSVLAAGAFEIGGQQTFIARLLPTGAVDQNYHHAVLGPVVPAMMVTAGALDGSGRMVILGPFQTVDGQPAPYMARILPDGHRDGTFTLSSSVGIPTVFAILPDGRIVIGGSGGVSIVKTDGSLDASVATYIGITGVSAMAVSRAGEIAIAGADKVRILRSDLTENVSFSSSFGFSLGVDDLKFAADGGVLASGVWTTDSPQFGIVRFFPNGSVDNGWSSLGRTDGRVEHMRIGPTGDVYMSGRFASVQGVSRAGVARLHGPNSGAAQWVNNSARATVSGSDQPLILGFVVQGDEPIQALVRAVGPSLAAFGVFAPLQHPKITLYAGSTQVYSTSGWSDTADMRTIQDSVGAFPLSKNSADSAGIVTLQPGAYTLTITAPVGETGAALGEVYKVQ
jgi:hypothetical protein